MTGTTHARIRRSMRPGGRRLRWRTIDIVTAPILGVALGLVYWGWDQLNNVITLVAAFAFPPLGGILGGGWLIAAVVGGMIIRRPGAALLVELVAAFIEMALGNQWGFSTMISGLIQGAGAELIFAVFAYRRFGMPPAMLAGTLAAVLESLYEWFSYYPDWHLGFKIIYLVLFAVSGALLAGLCGWLLVRGLAATGVLDAFGPGRERHERRPA